MLGIIINILARMLKVETEKNGFMAAAERRAAFMKSVLANNVMTLYKRIKKGLAISCISMQRKNKKMQPTEKIGFLIFSIPAVITCPFATSLCMKYCYAKSGYRYESITKSHVRNWIESQKSEFVQNCINYIYNAIYCKNGKIRKDFQKKDGTLKDICIRIHESGDFYSSKYFRDWCDIARAFPNFTFYAYTKSVPFVIENLDYIPKNFIVRISFFPDTPIEFVKLTFKYHLPFYMAMERENMEDVKANFVCDCAAGCGKCGNMCSKTDKTVITTELKK